MTVKDLLDTNVSSIEVLQTTIYLHKNHSLWLFKNYFSAPKSFYYSYSIYENLIGRCISSKELT